MYISKKSTSFAILIFFTPAFLDIEIDVLLLVLLKFLNQSFKSLIVFNRKFKLNIGVESFFLVTLLLMVILEIEVLNLKILIQLIVIALAVKFLTFLYFSTLLTNYLANEYDPYYKNESSISINENKVYEKKILKSWHNIPSIKHHISDVFKIVQNNF